MSRSKCSVLKWIFPILLVIFIKCSDAELESNSIGFDSFDFEEMKNKFFSMNHKNVLENYSTDDDDDCVKELENIRNALESLDLKKEQWAFKLVDSWGKFPSGFLEGNMYELGAFSECFNILKDKKPYESKYCMGQIVINANLTEQSTKTYHSNINDIFFPSAFESDDESMITPRMIKPDPNPKPSINFGMCVPKKCRMDYFQELADIFHPDNKNFSITFAESTCQVDEYVTGLYTADWITIAILAVVLFFIVISTSYDVICTLYDHEKNQAMLAFSFYTNGTKLLSYKKSKSADMMNCLNGIRVISTAWVVLGHTFVMYMMLPIRNKAAIPEFATHYHNMMILSALVSVDSFFVISGLLVSYNMMKRFEKTKGRVNVLMLYVHRYLRLTPFLAIAILFSSTLLRFLGNGPLWPNIMDALSQQCARNWWSTLLYVQNYVNPKDICFGHSWYLSVDTQLFVLSPLIMYLIYRFETKAILGMIVLVLGCVGCTISSHVENGYKAVFTKFDTAYVPTHLRYSPWLIGIILGYILFKVRNRRVNIPRLFNLFAWALSLATMVAVIFANYPLQQFDSKNTPLEFGLYDALSRVGWAIALCYIIFACVHNSGGVVNWFLSHPLWQPFSRMSYAIYLLHFPTIMVVMSSLKTPMYFSELTAFHTFIGNFVLTVFIAIVATLAFESPLIIVEKMIFGTGKKPEKSGPNGTKGANGLNDADKVHQIETESNGTPAV